MFGPTIGINPHGRAESSVLLRPVTYEEIVPLSNLDDEARRYLALQDQVLLASPTSTYERLTDSERWAWGIEVTGQGGAELVGLVSLRNLWAHYPDMGRTITRTEHLGQGIGTLAAIGVAACAIVEVAASGIQAETLKVNKRAQASLRNAGFVQVPPDAYADPKYPYGMEGDTSVMTLWQLFGSDVDYETEVSCTNVDWQVVAGSYNTFKSHLERIDITIRGIPVSL